MVSKFTYLFFFDGVLWRIFLLLRANRLYLIFNIGLKKMAPSCPRYFFVFFYPEYLALVLPTTNPVQRLTFLNIYFRWREGVPTSVLGFQPIIWLLSSSPWSDDFLGLLDVTQVRLLSTNICWSSPQPTFFILTCFISLNGHSLTACYC